MDFGVFIDLFCGMRGAFFLGGGGGGGGGGGEGGQKEVPEVPLGKNWGSSKFACFRLSWFGQFSGTRFQLI